MTKTSTSPSAAPVKALPRRAPRQHKVAVVSAYADLASQAAVHLASAAALPLINSNTNHTIDSAARSAPYQAVRVLLEDFEARVDAEAEPEQYVSVGSVLDQACRFAVQFGDRSRRKTPNLRIADRAFLRGLSQAQSGIARRHANEAYTHLILIDISRPDPFLREVSARLRNVVVNLVGTTSIVVATPTTDELDTRLDALVPMFITKNGQL